MTRRTFLLSLFSSLAALLGIGRVKAAPPADDDALMAKAKAYHLPHSRLRELTKTKRPPASYFEEEDV